MNLNSWSVNLNSKIFIAEESFAFSNLNQSKIDGIQSELDHI